MTRTSMTLKTKVAKVVVTVIGGALLATSFTLLQSTPASAVNPVGSIQFNGNNSLKYWPGAPGSQNTTIEFWMKQTGTGNLQRIYTTSWSFAANNITIRSSGTGCIDANVANNSLQKPGGTDYSCPTLNVWHHIALVGLGTTWKFYVDGNLALTRSTWSLTSGWADPTKPNITDSSASIGGWENSERFVGYISNVREVIGTAVYTSNFTPVNPPLTATQSAGSSGINAITSGTALLLNTRYDGTLATAQADTSVNALTPGIYGTPVASNDTPVLAETSITNFTVPPLTYGTAATLSATSSVAGTVTFLVGGSIISGCSLVAENGSNTATCSYTPTSTTSKNFTLNFKPTANGYASLTGVSSTDVVPDKASLAVVPGDRSIAFGGTPSYTNTYSGFVNGDSASTSTFTTGLVAPTCSASAYTTSTSVSSSPLSITCSGGSSANYTFTYGSTANLTITQATPTLSLSLSAASPTYGAVDTITATASVAGAVTFKSGGTNISGCENVATSGSSPIAAQCAWVPSGVTSYSLTAVLTPTNTVDFSGVTAMALTPTSVRTPITVTPTAGQSKVFGANNPTLTYSITSGALVGSDELTGALTYTGSNVGNYAIGIGTLANANYIITLASVAFSITQATQAAVTLSSLSSAYNPSNKTVTLTGSGGSGTGSYGYALDLSNVTPGCSVSGSTLTYTTAGTCIIAVTRSSDTNYLSRTDIVSFSIGLASQTITFGSLSAKGYSSDTFTVTATSSSSLAVSFTSGSQSVCTTSGSYGGTITLLGVGTCVINANQVGDANTAAASQVSQNFSVNPRAITVTADAKTKVYGATDPTLTYTITSGSLVLGDAITGALTRATGSDAGTYQIQQGAVTTANNPKYAITFVAADLEITRATPTLALTYPNSNVAILRPGATDTPTVTTSSSAGTLTFATTASSSICTVDSTSGVISLFGAGSCVVVMATAQTTNYIQHFETTTVTVALLSTSLVGINQSNLVSMGQPFYAHASIDQSYSFSSGSNGASVAIPAGTLDPSVPISISLLTDATSQRAIISSDGTSVLSVVVSWVASDGSVPSTNTGKAISVTLTNPSIKSGAKIYSIIGNQSQLLGTATADGSVTTLITDDPVLLVINPVVTPPSSNNVVVQFDNSAALALAKAAAEAKALEEEKAAAALKAAQEKMEADAKALAAAKAADDAAALKAAQDAADASAREAALLQAAKDAEIAAANAAKAIKPQVTLYLVSSKLKLSAYDSAYLAKYVNSLKNGASVTCIGYTYGKSPASKASQALAKRQATAVCTEMKKTNKTLKTSIVIYPASKAPKAAAGAKWVGVSYRIDGFKK